MSLLRDRTSPGTTTRRALRIRACVLAAIAALHSAPAVAEPDRPPAALEADVDGRRVALPLLKTFADVRIQGDLATVRLTQVFANPSATPIHARYVFPLPSNAAVYAMRITSGGQQIEAEIHRKAEARAIFENAKERGNQAALLEQHRPNVFSQEVANLMPGAPVQVDLEYAHVVPKGARGLDGDYVFQFPMVVGPRYVPAVPPGGSAGAPTGRPGEPEGLEIGRWSLPASAPVAPPSEIDRERVQLFVQLDGGVPIRRVSSPTHHIAVDRRSPSLYRISLAEGPTVDNRDFVLQYRLAGDEVSAGATTQAEDGQGFVSLLLEPPAEATGDRVSARELVFVLDCSGSMAGVPLEASKRFMRRALPQLRASDSFRIIRFSDAASEWGERPLPATPENVQRALAYVDRLYGSGGTEMTSGIRTAFAPPVPEGAIRLVVFLTDGYIGNDLEVVRLVESRRGDARVFSFGVGSGVNRWLLEEMARVGRGASRIVLQGEDAEAAADELAARLASPVLTDVSIDWGTAPVSDVFPSQVPDLFLGRSVHVIGRYAGSGTYRVVVHGRVAGRPVSLPLELALPDDTRESGGAALPIVWARAAVADRMARYQRPGASADAREALKQEVVALGLEHRLVTRWTSFVAVAREVVNPGGQADDADVPVPPGAGLARSAYPPGALPGLAPVPPSRAVQLVSAGGFAGSAAPEPATGVAIVFMTIAGVAVASWNRRRLRGIQARDVEDPRRRRRRAHP